VRRSGISPLLAAMIVLSAALVVAGMVAQVYMKSSQADAELLQRLQIEQAKAQVQLVGTMGLDGRLWLMNTGTRSATIVKVVHFDQSGNVQSVKDLAISPLSLTPNSGWADVTSALTLTNDPRTPYDMFAVVTDMGQVFQIPFDYNLARTLPYTGNSSTYSTSWILTPTSGDELACSGNIIPSSGNYVVLYAQAGGYVYYRVSTPTSAVAINPITGFLVITYSGSSGTIKLPMPLQYPVYLPGLTSLKVCLFATRPADGTVVASGSATVIYAKW